LKKKDVKLPMVLKEYSDSEIEKLAEKYGL
jgi:hypothetical protein